MKLHKSKRLNRTAWIEALEECAAYHRENGGRMGRLGGLYRPVIVGADKAAPEILALYREEVHAAASCNPAFTGAGIVAAIGYLRDISRACRARAAKEFPALAANPAALPHFILLRA